MSSYRIIVPFIFRARVRVSADPVSALSVCFLFFYVVFVSLNFLSGTKTDFNRGEWMDSLIFRCNKG